MLLVTSAVIHDECGNPYLNKRINIATKNALAGKGMSTLIRKGLVSHQQGYLVTLGVGLIPSLDLNRLLPPGRAWFSSIASSFEKGMKIYYLLEQSILLELSQVYDKQT